ncbi:MULTISPECIES: CdaR family transcriptional regulator [unclassified Mycolicibacterium]|uniref:PucR family transcriptional regulator n=1 Tax=unclassified Mycolicibacterium TaxID=2636767 RepID=UPI0012DEFE0D|nr:MULTISPECIES: helix-turn-helix domain-containing protein [unclassified Mycolicibacterium]MUL83936.1 PucR family transcriptional regulator [Mycolicibacterium sp. CBMA 329]MUL89998.1 PucR family transcriptional regulator [Mycolicibacterium sp. CBMA 331]MUL97981.1 PucR family transcriptional regulator [Mycolicibacterium sp. CBMA 334]MUM27913.1 PucR family transcriptional regulator [Mycolicibacterium sp. CBMA 295]MUM39513.1 PucR family transcriptional regulator [Mycolicibacterium sp. CBMA 247]
MSAQPDPHIARLVKTMLARADELTDAMCDEIRRVVGFYESNTRLVTADELHRSCLSQMTYVLEALAGAIDADVSAAEDVGIRRAVAGVPLVAVMSAYRVGFRFTWEATLAEAKKLGISADAILATTSQILDAQDTFTQAMTGAYRRELTRQVLGKEEERSALVEAILMGRITDTQNLWDAADILRLPTAGPYVVVAAQVPGIGRTGLPEIANRLDARDIRSAWRLLPDLQVGIVHLRRPSAQDDLLDVLRGSASARVGVSPSYRNLAETGEALRYARLAVAGKGTGDGLVQVFDDSPLAIAAVAAPEAMQRISRDMLSAFAGLPAEDRGVLVETFGAWLEAGGSTNDTAARIYVHPNTVRHRLRRIEEYTGKSLTRPRDIAELCLAFEVDRRLS